MEVGVGLPTHLAGVSGRAATRWAVHAEELGFCTLAATDRLAGGTWDPLVALSGAAAVTTRCRLLTNVIVVPNRCSAAQLAKQMMTLNRLSEGRFIAGVGVGDREDDYRLCGQSMEGRHGRFEEMLTEMHSIWAGLDADQRQIGPRRPEGGPRVLMGGRSSATFDRAARHGIGWTVSISSPAVVRAGVEELRLAWARAGRYGEPRVVALAYFGLGPEAPAATPAYLRSYYEFMGPIAETVASTAPTSAEGIRDVIAAYVDAGADELIFLPTIPDPDELDLLGEAAHVALQSVVSARSPERW